jgi:trigger factor
MKADIVDVSPTQKQLTIEIPREVVDAEIERVTRSYSKTARLPGFRPGKVPPKVAKQRFKEQILQDAARDLVSKAVDEALQERGVEPLDSPDIKDFAIDEGQPLKFTAEFETVPAFDPGDLSTLIVQQPPATLEPDAVEKALLQLRDRAARYEPVEGRPIADGDTAVLDIDRTNPDGTTEKHEQVPVTLGAQGNPPGFDANLAGLSVGETKAFSVHFPEDYVVEEMRNTEVTYAVVVKEIRHRVLPSLDDEFAKDLGQFDTFDALRARVHSDLQQEAEAASTRGARTDLLRQLSERVPFDLPAGLVDREMDRRVEEFAQRLLQQRIDPRQANIDWAEFREAQRQPARNAVSSAIVLDEIARRENLVVGAAALDKEIDQIAERVGRTAVAVRAQLEKDGGIVRIAMGLRREMAVDFAMAHVKVIRQ